jgi:hypothetical protein
MQNQEKTQWRRGLAMLYQKAEVLPEFRLLRFLVSTHPEQSSVWST